VTEVQKKILTTTIVLARLPAIALALLPAASWAQVDTSEWKCELCPFENGYEAEYEAGAVYVSDSAARFGNATGLDDDGGKLALGGNGRYASDGFQVRWNAADLALDSREFDIEAGRQGTYGIYLEYRELPYRQFDTTETIFTASGNDFLSLPPGWVTAGTTAGFTELANSLVPRNTGSDRTNIGAGGHFLLSRGFKFFADYRREDKEGIQITSGSGFTQSSMLPRMIDYQTDTIDLGLRYANGPLALSFAWYGSFFENNASSLTWENPFFNDPATPGFEPYRMALEPDNDFQQFSLSGSYRFQTLDTLLGFTAASGGGTQNAPLLPYTVNPNLVAGVLPVANIDGKVDTSNYSVTLTSRPIPKGRIYLSYRFDERDNQTPQSTWTRVIVDTFVSADPEMNTPYSFERTRMSASADYELFDDLRLSAGYERNELDRDFQEVAEQTEDNGWGRARWRPADWLDISVKGGATRREIDRYNETVATGFGQNPLLRKYNLAYRYREYGEVILTTSPASLPVSATLSAMYADDSFTQSQLGMTEASNSHISLDLSWAVSDYTTAYLLAGGEDIDADQTGAEGFAAPDWSAFHRDSFSHYGGGIEWRNIGENTDVILDYTHTDGDTSIRVYRTGVGPSDYPDIATDFDSLRLKLRYQKSDRLDIDLDLRYESFKTNDWALAGVNPDTLPAVLTLGADPYDYDVWAVGLSFRYLIGQRDISFPE
jgi:MtrB/PioB family decaheme-associated outer membrane protein